MNIFIDDERLPEDVTWENLPKVDWKIIRTYREFCNTLQEFNPPENISFDNDLADFSNDGKMEEKTGYDCVKFLIDYCEFHDFQLPKGIFYHTKNPIGRGNMKSAIESYRQYRRFKNL